MNTYPQPICPAEPYMGDHACTNPTQCFEPCGHLGHSMEHAVAVGARPLTAPTKVQIGPLDV